VKLQRGTAKGAFTRAKNLVNSLVDKGAGDERIANTIEVMEKVYKKLEEAHTNYLVTALIDLDAKPDQPEATYLNVCSLELADALYHYEEYYNRNKEAKDLAKNTDRLAKKREKFVIELKALDATIRGFRDLERKLNHMIRDRISMSDLREEIKKLELA